MVSPSESPDHPTPAWLYVGLLPFSLPPLVRVPGPKPCKDAAHKISFSRSDITPIFNIRSHYVLDWPRMFYINMLALNSQ